MTNNTIVSKQAIIKAALPFLMIGFIVKVGAMFGFGVHLDTSYYLNIASYFIEDGEITPYMWRLGADTNIIAGSGTGYGVYILTYWIKWVGLSLMSGYILMYVAGIITLIPLYVLVRDWWDSDTSALVAVTFTAIAGYFIITFYVRMDILGILAYTLVLALHLSAVRSRNLWLHALTGIAVIAAAEIHILATIYVGALSFYYLWEQIKHWRSGNKVFAITPSIAFYVGAFVAGVIYLMVHVLPDPQAYFIISQGCTLCSPPGPVKELGRIFVLVHEFGPEMVIIAIGIALSYLRKSNGDKHLLKLLIGYVLAQAVISPPVQKEYLTHMLPLFALFAGGIFYRENQTEEHITYQQLFISVCMGLVVILRQVLIVTVTIATSSTSAQGIEYIQTHVPQETVIMGIPGHYHQLLEFPNYLSYKSGEKYGITLRDEDYDTFYQRERPQLIIGTPDATDVSVWRYMRDNNFTHIIDNLSEPDEDDTAIWISGALLSEITASETAPVITFTTPSNDIQFEECLILDWSVEHGEKTLLAGDQVAASGSREVCPLFDTDYTLSVLWAGGMVNETITITVD